MILHFDWATLADWAVIITFLGSILGIFLRIEHRFTQQDMEIKRVLDKVEIWEELYKQRDEQSRRVEAKVDTLESKVDKLTAELFRLRLQVALRHEDPKTIEALGFAELENPLQGPT